MSSQRRKSLILPTAMGESLLYLGFSLFLIVGSHALAAAANTTPLKVIVSGAGGQTGQSLFRKFLALPDEFQPIGLVRSEQSKAALVESGVPESNIAVVDVTDAASVKSVVDDSVAAFCICTSAKPAMTDALNPETGRPVMDFPNGQPELVDWQGQKNQIDACPPGTHVVLCSTMGGTNPDHPLNNIGRKVNEDGSISGGMIVQWKRKSEVYLMEQKHLKYTIIHPGGLINEPGGERELVVGVDDDLTFGNTDSRSIPREDVANVMLNAVRHPAVFAGRSFDLRAKAVGEGKATTNFESLLDPLKGRNCDYSLGKTM